MQFLDRGCGSITGRVSVHLNSELPDIAVLGSFDSSEENMYTQAMMIPITDTSELHGSAAVS